MAIFVHKDCDGDELEVSEAHEDWSERHRGSLAFMVTHHSNEQTSALPRDRVRSLRDALNRWLDEQQSRDPNPAGSNTAPPYEALVRRLVAEEVARVMPLHQSPQAAVVPEHRPQECPGATCPEYASNTGLPLCLDPFCTKPRDHAEHDPEPQAVGHPEAPGIDWTDKSGVRYEYCTECGHVWGAHSPSDVRHGCGAILGKGRCGCEAVRPERPTGCECGHAWVDHGRFGLRGCGVLPCECSRAVPRSTS